MLDLLNQDELENIRQDVEDILEDCQYENPIVYRRLVSRTINLGTGAPTIVYSDTKLRATRGDMTARAIASSGGRYQIGDEFVMFPPSDVDFAPKPDDRIMRLITDAGDVRLDYSSDVVTGYNTKFLADGVLGGDMLSVTVSGASLTSTIKGSISDDEEATLKDVWPTGTIRATEFKIYRTYEIVQRIVDPLKAAVRLVVRRMGS